MRRWGAAALVLLATSCAGPRPAAPPGTAPVGRPSAADSLLGLWRPALSPPRADSSGRIDWTPRLEWSREAARVRRAQREGDTLSAWRAIAADTGSLLRSYAVERLAIAALARGDTLEAEGLIERLVALPGAPAWEAVRLRCDVALARVGPAAADSLLESADRTAWSDLERAAWLARRAQLALAQGDTSRALDLARQTLRRYPSLAPASSAIVLLERLATVRGTTLSTAEMEMAAESERLRGDRAAAARRLAAARERSAPAERGRLDLRLAQVLREARRYADGLTAADRAIREASDDEMRERARLERARLLRDSGKVTDAITLFSKVAGGPGSIDVRAAAAWELAIEHESARRFDHAREAYGRVVTLGGDRRNDARLRIGLIWVASGSPGRALDAWGDADGEPFRFWRGILARATDRRLSDSLLAAVARSPGYGFYAVAARETLGLRGWTGRAPARDSCSGADARILGLAEARLAVGDVDGASVVLQRWSALGAMAGAQDSSEASPAVPAGGPAPAAAAHLSAARLALAAGRTPLAIRLSQRAFNLSARAGPEVRWSLIAWFYPPAFDSLYAVIGDSARSGAIDASLLRAVAWQESRFDSAARSRSGALGLYQLKLATAGDMARRLRTRAPTERDLFTPATSLRLGREYLNWLLERFDGESIVALAAYNAGPSSIPEGYRALLDRGGPALFCEMIGRGETFDYVRRILGARQAYRELRPYVSPPR